MGVQLTKSLKTMILKVELYKEVLVKLTVIQTLIILNQKVDNI